MAQANWKKNWLIWALTSVLSLAVTVPAQAAKSEPSKSSSKSAAAKSKAKTVAKKSTSSKERVNRSAARKSDRQLARATAKKSGKAETRAERLARVRAEARQAKVVKRPSGIRTAAASTADRGAVRPLVVRSSLSSQQGFSGMTAAAGPVRASYGQIYGLHHTPDPLDLQSSVALVMDQDTNEVVFAKNSEAMQIGRAHV